MCVIILKSKYVVKLKTISKDFKRSILNAEKIEDDASLQNFGSEINLLNNIIQNILSRNLHDSVLTFYCINILSDCLFDNLELMKVFLYALFNSNINVINFTFYDMDLDEALKIKTQNINYRSGVSIIRIKEWNYCLLFKAFTNLVIVFI